MPRKPQVSRTMKTTLVHCLVFDCLSHSPYETDIRLSRQFKKESDLKKQLIKYAENKYNGDLKVVQILDTTKQTVLFSMSEQDYVDSAEIQKIIYKGDQENV